MVRRSPKLGEGVGCPATTASALWEFPEGVSLEAIS
jgi:hypothetical protein